MKNLKPVPADKKKSLGKLPTDVRNKMGYAQKGKMMSKRDKLIEKQNPKSEYKKDKFGKTKLSYTEAKKGKMMDKKNKDKKPGQIFIELKTPSFLKPKEKAMGGEMKKPMGYKSGMGPGGAGGSMAGRPGGRRPMQQGPKGGIGSLSKNRSNDDLLILVNYGDGKIKKMKRSEFEDNMSPPKQKMGGGMMKAGLGKMVKKLVGSVFGKKSSTVNPTPGGQIMGEGKTPLTALYQKVTEQKTAKKSMGGEMKQGYGAARTSGMGLQDEDLIPGKSMDYYKDLM